MKLGYDLTLKQTQKLMMTPELIQAIQILQFNSQELETYVQDQLLANPVLETAETDGNADTGGASDANADAGAGYSEKEGAGYSETEGADFAEAQAADAGLDWKEYIRNSNYGGVDGRTGHGSAGAEQANAFERFAVNEITLPEHLMFQYQFASVNKSCRRVGKYIIESLDENGYMTSTPEEIAQLTGVSREKVSEVLDIIHGLEPAGVGARDLGECLKLQLKAEESLTEEFEQMIDNHLEDIAANRLSVIAKAMGISVQKAQEMADVIRCLEPKPGRQFASENETKYVIPDVFVEKNDDGYAVVVNESSSPRLMISSYYKDILRRADTDKQLSEYLSERVNSANWLIKSIAQRKETIFNVVTAVVKFQKDFFDYGSKHLKVLTLKDVAEEIGMHESTVSRSINGKYLQCSRGVFEIKYFFSAGVSNELGEGISSNSVKEFIRELIANENSEKPLSDQKIVRLLESKGFDISRRTVAKYRDDMGILSSSKRKRY